MTVNGEFLARPNGVRVRGRRALIVRVLNRGSYNVHGVRKMRTAGVVRRAGVRDAVPHPPRQLLHLPHRTAE
jgi:hypothetical protein